MLLHFPSKRDLPRLKKLPIVAIDIGFSKRKTCGVAFKEDIQTGLVLSCTVHFGGAIEEVLRLIQNHSEVTCIIEAPLSGLLNSEGNPICRKFEFEKKNSQIRLRPWYTQAGPAVTLATIIFLREVQKHIPKSHALYLIEGFVSFKKEPSSHENDACRLLESFTKEEKPVVTEMSSQKGETPINLLALAGLAPQDAPCPLVLLVNKSGE